MFQSYEIPFCSTAMETKFQISRNSIFTYVFYLTVTLNISYGDRDAVLFCCLSNLLPNKNRTKNSERLTSGAGLGVS